MTQEQKINRELLNRILSYISPSDFACTALYVTPAQQLRNQADLIEQKEKDYYSFKLFIENNYKTKEVDTTLDNEIERFISQYNGGRESVLVLLDYQRKLILSDLIVIADQGEYEDMRREIERYKNL